MKHRKVNWNYEEVNWNHRPAESGIVLHSGNVSPPGAESFRTLESPCRTVRRGKVSVNHLAAASGKAKATGTGWSMR